MRQRFSVNQDLEEKESFALVSRDLEFDRNIRT